jgi:hypothetical protein
MFFLDDDGVRTCYKHVITPTSNIFSLWEGPNFVSTNPLSTTEDAAKTRSRERGWRSWRISQFGAMKLSLNL